MREIKNTEVRELECESRLSHFLALLLWVDHLSSLSLSVLVCRMGSNEIYFIKYLTHHRHSHNIIQTKYLLKKAKNTASQLQAYG